MSVRLAAAWWALVLGGACVDSGRALDTGLGDPRVMPVTEPAPPSVAPGPLGTVVPPAPELLYAEPAALPRRHVVRVTLLPTGSVRVGEVQKAEVVVEVSGGPVGGREVSVLFVGPQGLAWERQAKVLNVALGATEIVRFALPVANTLIEDHGLSGRWGLVTLDDGVELASTSFEVAP